MHPPLQAIDLTRQPDFLLGPLTIKPSVLQAGGESLEPRVMQVLTALYLAGGAVVSRDDLIAQCWDGRIVGDDAINRVIGRLRRLSENDAGATFTIETITRIGYRLVTHAATAPAAPVTASMPPAAVSEEIPVPPQVHRKTALFAILAAALVLIAGGVLWWLTRPVQWVMDSFRLAVATPLFENDPALAPNGDMIAYAAGPTPYAWHIYIRNLTDGQPIQLTNGINDSDTKPNWSPTGDRIAFIRHREGVPCTIVIKPVPAGDEHVVGHCVEDDFTTLAWSPRGDALYFADHPTPSAVRRIQRLDLASGAVTAVTHPHADVTGDNSPVVSHDGNQLAFVRLAEGKTQRMVRNLQTGEERNIPVIGGGLKFGHAWTEEGDLIVTAGGLAEPALMIYPANGGPPQLLGLNPQELGSMSSGPGHTFAIEVMQDRAVLASPPDNGKTAPQILEATTGLSYFPDYAADGRLAFSHSPPGGLWEIWEQDPGGTPRQLTALGASYIRGVHWSPDGSRLAFFAAVGKARGGLYILNADGTGLKMIKTWPGPSGMPAWTEGGKGLIYAAKDNIGWRLWRSTLAQPQVATPVTDYGWFSVHASGEALYAMGTAKDGIWRIDGTPHYVAPAPRRCTDAFLECQTWFVSGDTLIFADHSDRNLSRIVLHSLKDGSERSVPAPALNYNDEIARDPVTGKLLYVYDGLGDSDIALFHLTRK